MDERNLTYMFYGLLAAWLVLAGYVVSLASRERNLRKAIDGLRRVLEDREKSS